MRLSTARSYEGTSLRDANDGREPVWEQLPSGRVVHRFEWIVLAAALAIIPVLLIETEANARFWREVATAANWIIWSVFLAEVAFVLVVAPRRLAAVRAHLLDVLIVVLTVPAYGALLSAFRLARLARLVRLLRLGMVVTRAVQAERAMTSEVVFRFVALVTVAVAVAAGATQALVDAKDFDSVRDGIWWAVVTMTTSSDELVAALTRIERELADVKRQLAAPKL
jgi:voltage-gated potassium channel